MEGVIDWLRDALGWVLAAIGTWVTYVTVRLHKQSERVAVLEQSVTKMVKDFDKIPADLRQQIAADLDEIKAEIRDMRAESRDGRESLRLELKEDIIRESDKRQRRN